MYIVAVVNKRVYGFCPTQNKETSIIVPLIPTGTLSNPNSYTTGIIDCEYCYFRECELIKKSQCPLINSVK